MSVTEVDAERALRCAFRLQQVAEDVRTEAARTARCFPADWRGEAGVAYQQRLDATADRVRRMAVAYDEAGASLVPYARALLDAQELMRRADGLLAQAAEAERLDAAASAAAGGVRLAGPSPSEGFRAAAAGLQAEAAEVEHRAAEVCAGMLDDEAGRTPAASGWRSADRFIGDLAQAGVGMVAGGASLVGDGWRSLPGVGTSHSRHEARHDLVASAKAALSVWQIPIDMRHAMEDDRPGLAAGELLSVVGPGTFSKLEKRPIHDVRLAHDQALRLADRMAELDGREVWRQSAEALGRNGADLLNEETRKGHAIAEHVDVSDGYLWSRVATGLPVASRFVDLAEAQRAVNAVLRARAEELPLVYGLTGNKKLALDLAMPGGVGLVAAAGATHIVVGRGVRVVLNLEGGEPRVFTAYPTR